MDIKKTVKPKVSSIDMDQMYSAAMGAGAIEEKFLELVEDIFYF